MTIQLDAVSGCRAKNDLRASVIPWAFWMWRRCVAAGGSNDSIRDRAQAVTYAYWTGVVLA
jgi:hypothetical protein